MVLLIFITINQRKIPPIGKSSIVIETLETIASSSNEWRRWWWLDQAWMGSSRGHCANNFESNYWPITLRGWRMFGFSFQRTKANAAAAAVVPSSDSTFVDLDINVDFDENDLNDPELLVCFYILIFHLHSS